MSDFVIEPPVRVALPVLGTDALFPVRRVYCVGRNYAAHAVEMGHDPDREPPFFFQKNADNLDPSGEFPYPSRSADVHHEVELAVALGSGGTDIAPEAALACVYGYAVALDMTRRDLQDSAKRLSRPWEVAKAFERSAPIGPIVPAAGLGHPDKGAVSLAINGTVRQEGDLAQMIWKVPEIVAHLSGFFVLAPGDVILSGTPAGVGPVVRGDRLEARIEGLPALEVLVI
ncbi:MAG: fumarylacetoacetate hydrolase family protein [Amaricoccus sp.]